MWYSEEPTKIQLDYSKPIRATNGSDVYILMPIIKQRGGYVVCGYDWFNFNTGSWNSCTFWETPQEAIDAYSKYQKYIISNCELIVN